MPTMEEHYKRFVDISQQIDTLGKTIGNEVQASQSHFKGQAAKAFVEVMGRYEGDRLQINDVLKTMADAIQTSGKNFHSTDASTSQGLTSAGSGLKH